MANLLNDLKVLAEMLFTRPVEPLVSPVPKKKRKPKQNIEKNIRKGFRAYSKGKKLPIEDYIPLFVEAAEKHPIFKQHPYLLPQIAILESSGGRNVTRPNNPLNWGARIQARGDYAPKSWEESIGDAISAIAGTRPPGPRQRQQTYYEPFRKSGDLRTFANTYEPANPSYYHNLSEGIKFFEGQ